MWETVNMTVALTATMKKMLHHVKHSQRKASKSKNKLKPEE